MAVEAKGLEKNPPSTPPPYVGEQAACVYGHTLTHNKYHTHVGSATSTLCLSVCVFVFCLYVTRAHLCRGCTGHLSRNGTHNVDTEKTNKPQRDNKSKTGVTGKSGVHRPTGVPTCSRKRGYSKTHRIRRLKALLKSHGKTTQTK